MDDSYFTIILFFYIKIKGTKGGIQDLTPINFIVNLVTDLLSENEFIGVVILPVKMRVFFVQIQD